MSVDAPPTRRAAHGGKSGRASARRSAAGAGAVWAARGGLLAILLLQAVLSLRDSNTAFEDEALYLYAGHEELAHMLHGASLAHNFATYFSGAPVFYPPLAAAADHFGGLAAARLLSLAFMLGATALLYDITRRVFGRVPALMAAFFFASCEATLFIGYFATYDACALFLLAAAAWLCVRTKPTAFWPNPIAAVLLVLAVGAKYAALMFVPVVLCLTVLIGLPRLRRLAVVRPVSVALVFGLLVFFALAWGGSDYGTAVSGTTTNRAHGSTSTQVIAHDSVVWVGVIFVAAVIGAFCLGTPRIPDDVDPDYVPQQQWARIALGALLAGTALLAPVYQWHLHTSISLHKHIAFGAFFAAPIAGYGLYRIVTARLANVQYLIAAGIAGLALAVGVNQASKTYHVWPDSTGLVSAIQKYQQPGAKYLMEAYEVPVYYLLGDPDAYATQFLNTFNFSYHDSSSGQNLTGNSAYVTAINQGYFQEVAYNMMTTPSTDKVIAAALQRSGRYKLAEQIPTPTANGTATYNVWVKTK